MTIRTLLVWTVVFGCVCALSTPGATAAEEGGPAWTVDFRYAPPDWQTSICLPDDWQKTLVHRDGTLLYDYVGGGRGFQTRISMRLAGLSMDWVNQALHAAKVPIVKTTTRRGPVQVVQESFAIAPRLGPDIKPPSYDVTFKRVGSKDVLPKWASPSAPCDPAFRNIAVGWRGTPIHYRFRSKSGDKYTVAFGLCEGHHTATGRRIQHLQVEGKTRKTLDLVADIGHRKPAVFPFPAKDENGDGWIDIKVVAAGAASDKNTILNALWAFPEGNVSPSEKIIAGPPPKGAIGYLDCGGSADVIGPPRHDLCIAHLVNKTATSGVVVPSLFIESSQPIAADPKRRRVRIGHDTTIITREAFQVASQPPGKLILHFPQMEVIRGHSPSLAFCVARGRLAADIPVQLDKALDYRKKAIEFWQKADLPYGHLEVPDAGIQSLLDSSIRNIYQAREIKGGLPAFQVGPTCYRGLWVVDGSFLMEAVTYLGRTQEARKGIEYLLGFQRDDGAIMIIDGHLKETGIALWAVARHARLTGDKAWLTKVWPKVEKGFAHIRQLRKQASAKPDAPNAGLLPAGFSDGGLGGKSREYTNIYWTMAGMKAAADAARWLGKTQQAGAWEAEYLDFAQRFHEAAARDTRADRHGNRYVPIRMVGADKVAPQRAQWAFLHAVFPGKVFGPHDPLVEGNMAMLKAVEREGLVFGTGWIADGIWNYFGSFYGHALLWLGQGQKAARTLYAFANHASPLLCWREEQMPQGQGDRVVGDMPHNWASAEFIRLVRHLLILERRDELHLLEGLPPAWVKPGAETEVSDVVTAFGPMSMTLTVDDDGKEARLVVEPPKRNPPSKIVAHLDGWAAKGGTITLPSDVRSEHTFRLR